jgi:hypothetical protein
MRGRCDRKHDVGAFGYGAVPQLQADHEADAVQRRQHRLRVGEVIGLDTAHEQCAQRAVGGGGDDSVGVTSTAGG